MVGALGRGLTLRDFETLTPGMIIDYIITWNNMNNKEDEEEKEADQDDYDTF